MDQQYYERIVDKELDLKLRAFGATHIVGPKWCGKTTTAEQKAKSVLKLQKDPNKEGLIVTAAIHPSALLNGEKPRLIDEWQDAPTIWDAVRVYCDDHKEKGNFILGGIGQESVKQAVQVAIRMIENHEITSIVPDYIEENVSIKVVKIIQSYVSVVNKVVWRK